MNGQTIAYIRVSTVEQNTDRQEKAISEHYKIDKAFIEKVSGKDTKRPELQAMLEYVRQGDRVVISELSRLARNLKDLLNIMNTLEEKDVKLISLKENIDTSTPTGRLMVNMIGAINEFERDIIKERQAEGIAIAKEKGRYKGRKKQIDIEFVELYLKYTDRKITKKDFAEYYEVSRPTLDRLIEEYEHITDTCIEYNLQDKAEELADVITELESTKATAENIRKELKNYKEFEKERFLSIYSKYIENDINIIDYQKEKIHLIDRYRIVINLNEYYKYND